ncbi:MAG: SDR family oxidoreductase [Chlamydiia bacterium]|nr:SDR family oxidoreductase [Chlamydiia bacterium]
MKVLLTGANGYIGQRLLPLLAEMGHQVIALVRSPSRLHLPDAMKANVQVVTADLLDRASLAVIPTDIDAAFFLVHSMSHSNRDFAALEERCVRNFCDALQSTQCKQLVYLSGLINSEQLSEHLASRLRVEEAIKVSSIPYTVLRAGIIIGSGSASFEIIRDLVEKLPIMIAPRWVMNHCQPISIYDVLYYLSHVLQEPKCLNQVFDIGGPDQLSYRDMLLGLAKVRKLRRYIIPVPVLTPRLSSYWLYFVTSTNFSLARALVDSLKNEAVCNCRAIHQVLPHDCLSYEAAVQRAFSKIEENAVVSSWKDALVRSDLEGSVQDYIQVPKHGTLTDITEVAFDGDARDVVERIWKIGGTNGWYAMNWAWRIRGYLDKLVGGVGLRRGRTHPTRLRTGDALDFWRVLKADHTTGNLLLYAEMRLPGEAWLEWKVEAGHLTQIATFRPKGLLGRLYWYALLPAHHFIFGGMARSIANGDRHG